MMDAAREWLLGVTAAAILAALAEGLMQEGGPKRVGRLVCGLVLLAAVFRPAAELTLPAEGGLSGYSAQIEEQADRLRTDTNDWMKLVIEEQCAAYVMDKAAELGITCQVRVTCTQEEAGVFLPWRCSVTGDLAQEEQEQAPSIDTSGYVQVADPALYAKLDTLQESIDRLADALTPADAETDAEAPTEEQPAPDYTAQLSGISAQLADMAQQATAETAEDADPFQKPFEEYTTGETLALIGVVLLLVFGVFSLFKNFVL